MRAVRPLHKVRRTIRTRFTGFNPATVPPVLTHTPARIMNPIVVIPARMASTRLPGKPLADIHGRPMILHVLDRAREAGIGPIAVACADREIAAAVRADGALAVITDPSLPRGSDRVHVALAALDAQRRYDVVINLQGDLPTIPPAYLRTVLAPLADPRIDIATLVAPIASAAEAASPSVVKAACAFDDGAAVAPALYFSRAAIPAGDGPLWHHWHLRLPPGGARALRRAAGKPVGEARVAGAVACAGGGHAHCLRAGGARPVRRGHGGGP